MKPIGTEQGFAEWLTAFRPRAQDAGIASDVLDRALAQARFNPKIVERDRNQSEFTKTIWEYLDTAVSEDRVANGKRALARHDDVLRSIETAYGVDRHVVAAIWGLESAYGSFRGDISTIEALATLAYDARRAAFFEEQLIAALKIIANGDVTVQAMRGSWAGAMGHTQFMPTSWWAHAVDSDGDGKRDVWSDDPTDALASAAAYLQHWGWTPGALWGLEITLPEGFDYDQTTERVKKPVADWLAMGVRPVGGGDMPDHGLASVLLPGGARGAAFLIFSNFQVIERYNTADAYVIAIGHLADRLRGGPAIQATWPRELRALRLDERMELQERLGAAGFDPQGVDGRIGPNTIAAVKAFQRANGRVPDGYASLEILQALR
ncbi:MAG: lytic murein transglycosylase [Pseudotabrizicola sp.]|uniref:lytic murein transglycosylase n=1 Tax=Pseudotabrizicola sp. TaxID=2939647 RepID=UPI002715C035|nr:lytic murein transglycosylase [Pseudotabrizicola sp.]MDO8884773.1 lytic murein transglycosylase [Pseudotabrizicola sp.]MDP2081908.1 lytic murein transglycosylase [Pseudotabrizicola sp.]MDZ7575980.1 lytic murein transglycosylase [Pseudotabrizicola sp.]